MNQFIQFIKVFTNQIYTVLVFTRVRTQVILQISPLKERKYTVQVWNNIRVHT